VLGNRHAPIWNSGRRGDSSADCNRLNATLREHLAPLVHWCLALPRYPLTGMHIKRDTLLSIAYSEELISSEISATLVE